MVETLLAQDVVVGPRTHLQSDLKKLARVMISDLANIKRMVLTVSKTVSENTR